MDELIGFLVIGMFILGLIYGCIKQIQFTIAIRNNQTVKKVELYKCYLACIFYLGFVLSYLLNILVNLPNMAISTITSSNTSISCYLFLILLILTKIKLSSRIIPKAYIKSKKHL